MRLIPNAYPIGRIFPDVELSGLIHAAAPNHRNDAEVIAFNAFNDQLVRYIDDLNISRLVVVGSWWQYASGECRNLLYTKLKDQQRRIFMASHVIPYSIYGDEARPGRGFIPQLIDAINNRSVLSGLSDELRDFIHVTDVARACIAALDAPHGDYSAATHKTVTPRELAQRYGITAPDYVEYPSALPNYCANSVPNWHPIIDIDEHIKSRSPEWKK